ncbi:MAG: methyltransferase [Bradyrhizobium icense]|nr:MAG: methyltransferase [Bradyrhizobium icense]
MDEWIDYYDSTHTIYVSKLHRDRHFAVIARDIAGYIPSADAVVLDYACGEALSAGRVADGCALLYLAEPAPGVRGRLIARFAPNTKIRVRSLEDVRKMAENSVDLVVMFRDVVALLQFAAKNGFLKDALIGLISTALSDYRELRTRVGLQRYSEDEIKQKLAKFGFSTSRAPHNIGHNPWRMTFVARQPITTTRGGGR